MSYEVLQDLLRSERRSNRPGSLAPRFWIETRTFLESITQQFRNEQARDPFNTGLMRLIDQVKNARGAAESLWAVRERKLAQAALAREGKRPDGLTPEEVEVWNGLRQTLDRARETILQQAGTATSAAAVAGVPLAEPVRATPPAARATPPAPAPPVAVPADTQAAAQVELVTIRALGDIPPFVGPDMQTYLLKEGDLASVPPSIANLLIKRKKAALVADA